LTGCALAPALPALLLSASRIDTSDDCRRLIIDNFYLVNFDSDSAAAALATAHRLRLQLGALQCARLRAPGRAAEPSESAAGAEVLPRSLAAAAPTEILEIARHGRWRHGEAAEAEAAGDGEVVRRALVRFFTQRHAR